LPGARSCRASSTPTPYTAGAAYAGGQERERGTLTPGERADLVVLEGSLDPEHPPRAVQTWVGGALAYAAPS